jgi:ABC-type polysaccharide/polyol phosphate transport system ATPase subunit
MSDDIVITVNQVSKSYRIWNNPAARLIAPTLEGLGRLLPLGSQLNGKASEYYKDFTALQDISLTVRKGEAVGIIGRNGSGKSTLLQIISGTLQPTAGTVEINGRIAALLELGSGFNPEFTGRENIFLYGAVLGLSRQDMEARYAAIADFADIGDFINQPVRTYSSGMAVRLAFAVAAHVDPSVLIVDEALSVGDARFQLKCARAIDRFLAQGVTLLFVSHDVSMVKRLCQSAVLLDGGRMIYAGRPNDVVNLYSKLMADGGTVEALAADIAALREGSPAAGMEVPETRPAPPSAPRGRNSVELPKQSGEVENLRLRIKALETALHSRPDSDRWLRQVEELWRDERRHVQLSGQEFSYGGELGSILSVEILDAEGQGRTWFTTGVPVVVRMVVVAHEDLHEPIFALTIKNSSGVEIYGTNTLYGKQPAPAISPGVKREVTFSFDLNVMPGAYFISVGFTHFVGDELIIIHRRYDVIKFDVHGVDRTFGIANLKAAINSRDLHGEDVP